MGNIWITKLFLVITSVTVWHILTLYDCNNGTYEMTL